MISLQADGKRREVIRRYPYLKCYIKGKPLHPAYFLCYPDGSARKAADDDPGPLEMRESEPEVV
jgi:hypothetical protein